MNKRAICVGVVNHCSNFRHWHYFFDIDGEDLETVKWTARFVAQRFNMDILIRHSGGGFHLIGVNPLTERECREAQRWTPTGEQDYFILDFVAESVRTPQHQDLPTGCVLRYTEKGKKKVPTNVALILSNVRRWCKGYADLYHIEPIDAKVVSALPELVIYETETGVL